MALFVFTVQQLSTQSGSSHLSSSAPKVVEGVRWGNHWFTACLSAQRWFPAHPVGMLRVDK